ncbi:hypothetical protein GCM10010178_03330 [Lentzea flava]|uniref:DUF4365 domain-containing protein n=1 Tax=Lentzea flava TaxID=103732 RepID=A0ABQ2U9V8_9PSEU|nr:protein of unknown function (DUF4365) [Lentzea flava]GGU15164.1 hypothetical protein GCM10010178_03330 [Lentzea flava]
MFREPGEEDLGIDAHFEIVEDGKSLGLLLAVQIKSGRSWFESPAEGGWWFRPDQDHVEYWLSHSIPVIVVLADNESSTCYWQHVSASTLIKSRKRGWKLLVPSTHVLDASAVVPLREVAEVAALEARGHVGVPIGELDAGALEVHGTLSSVHTPLELSEYRFRAHDARLNELLEDAMGPQAKSGIAVLVAISGAGKTRALYEALHRPVPMEPATTSLAESGWQVWPAVNPLPPRRFLHELGRVGPRTVVWLNEAQRYLLEPDPSLRAAIATALRELLADETRGPVLVMATLWHRYWAQITAKPAPEKSDELVAARRLIEGGYVRVPDTFTNAEVAEARRSGDRLLAAAANRATGTNVTQYLAGAPELLRRYKTACPAQQAIIHAAMDARRLGHEEILSEDFLSAAARCYLNSEEAEQSADDPSWFGTAIADLIAPGVASEPVLRLSALGYRLDDVLDEEGRTSRIFEFPPEGFWTAAMESDLRTDNRVRLAESAAARLRMQIAARLYEAVGTEVGGEGLYAIAMHCERKGARQQAETLARRAAELGYADALKSLAMWRRGRGGEHDPFVQQLLWEAAEGGDVDALDELATTLERAGDSEGAEALARKAVELGSWKAVVSIAGWRAIEDQGEARAMVASLPDHMRAAAMTRFALELDEVDDHDEAEEVALVLLGSGHSQAAVELADRWAQHDRKPQAARLLDRVGLPKSVEEALRVALTRISLRDYPSAIKVVLDQVGIDLGHAPTDIHDHEVIARRLAAFAQTHSATVVRELEFVLRRLDEEHLVAYLHTDMRPAPSDEPEPAEVNVAVSHADDDLEGTMYEVADAYATLAGYHAKRGDFAEAEVLAYRAAEAGSSDGLEQLSRELAERGNRAEADRLALCAVNMTSDWQGYGSSESAWAALAQARKDDALLTLGLDADGNTAPSW